jgi:tRNA U34 5-carboxymethylaminomethyl modifying GTPase MnmE/TrmE
MAEFKGGIAEEGINDSFKTLKVADSVVLTPQQQQQQDEEDEMTISFKGDNLVVLTQEELVKYSQVNITDLTTVVDLFTGLVANGRISGWLN